MGLFAFNCFDGSRGAGRIPGRIHGDGSVIGTIQFRGAGPARMVSLPAGTLRVRGEAVCASLQGMPFEPCFHIEKTDDRGPFANEVRARLGPKPSLSTAGCLLRLAEDPGSARPERHFPAAQLKREQSLWPYFGWNPTNLCDLQRDNLRRHF
jgi:hypothetical protein